MSPNDIKHIVNCVADYVWPWQWIATNGEWVTSEDQSLNNLLDEILTQPNGRSDNRQPPYVRLDPNHEWDWPIETRVDMPCWYRYRYTLNPASTLSLWDRRRVAKFSIDHIDYEYHVVAIHPLNSTMEPPSDWMPEGKRILK